MNSTLSQLILIVNVVAVFGYLSAYQWGKLGGAKYRWLWCLVFTATYWLIEVPDLLNPNKSMVMRIVFAGIGLLWTLICARDIVVRFFQKPESEINQ